MEVADGCVRASKGCWNYVIRSCGSTKLRIEEERIINRQ